MLAITFNNLVKKAGANYILEAGKLIGSYAKLDDNQRKRMVDVFMPYARSFNYAIRIKIPMGYNVKRLEQFNTNIKNPVGAFVSSAAIEGGLLVLSVNRSYEHNFEEVADWPKVMQLTDAVSKYTNQKILLEKSL